MHSFKNSITDYFLTRLHGGNVSEIAGIPFSNNIHTWTVMNTATDF